MTTGFEPDEHNTPGNPEEPGTQIRTEGEGVSELLKLAEEAKMAQSQKDQKKPPGQAPDPVQEINAKADALQAREGRRQEATRLAREELGRQDQEASDVGRYSYYALSGDQARLNQEKAPGVFSAQHRDKYVHMGGNGSNWEASSVINYPEDYLRAFDEMKAKVESWMEQDKGQPTNLEKFYEDHKNEILINERRKDGPNLVFRAADLPKEQAIALLNRKMFGPDNRHPHYQSLLEQNKLSIQGFGKAALEYGDIETALEANKRAGTLNDPELQARTKELITNLAQRGDPASRDRLRNLTEVLRKIG